MKRHVYDPDRAHRLVPLLRAIATEIGERTHAIDTLEARLEQIAHRGRLSEAQAERQAGYESALVVHRRELRVAKNELNKLGCTLDEDHPLRVLIPGADGNLAHGWSWTPADESLQGVT